MWEELNLVPQIIFIMLKYIKKKNPTQKKEKLYKVKSLKKMERNGKKK